ncbi:MAG TPA: hypothetical protein ENH15_03350 [Actinobacteria bacterium]|nr:hypothetical protein [Actinomycetota bacterium]
MFDHTHRTTMALLLTPLAIAAGGAAETTEYVCAPAKAVECDSNLECAAPIPLVAPPTFFHVNLNERVITLLGPAERRGEVTNIDHLEQGTNQVLMGGVEAGRAWSMAISEEDGQYTLTVNLGDVGWVVFGQCIAADLVSP